MFALFVKNTCVETVTITEVKGFTRDNSPTAVRLAIYLKYIAARLEHLTFNQRCILNSMSGRPLSGEPAKVALMGARFCCP
jgi:hypothetical protein